MSASESVRDAVQWLMATGELQRLVRDEIAPVVAEAMSAEAIATARAEGETAGYAKGRREAFSEAASMCDEASEVETHTDGGGGALVQAAASMAARLTRKALAAALRAKAGEGDPNEPGRPTINAEAPHE